MPSLLAVSSVPPAPPAKALTGPLGPPQRRCSTPSAACQVQNGLAPPPRRSVLPSSRSGTMPTSGAVFFQTSLPAESKRQTIASSRVGPNGLAKPHATTAPLPSSTSATSADTGPCEAVGAFQAASSRPVSVSQIVAD